MVSVSPSNWGRACHGLRLVAMIWAAVVMLWQVSSAAGGDWMNAPAQHSNWLPPVDESKSAVVSCEPFLAEVPQSRWSGRLGTVILQRGRPASEDFMIDAGGNTILNPTDLDFPFQGGVDAGLIWRGTLADVEIRYFGVEDSNASYGPIATAAGSQVNIPGVEPFNDPLVVGLGGHSALQSVEINLRRNLTPRLTWLVGFRYVSFRDGMNLELYEFSSGESETIVFGARNELFGLQLGGDAIVWQPSERFHVETAVKAGVYGNAAGSSLTSNNPVDPAILYLRRDNTAFVGDLIFTGVYQLDRHWAIRAGYELLWLSGVAAGSMQFHDMNFDSGQMRTNTSATVFYHGALVGVERSW